MDRIAEWRPVDSAGPEGAAQPEESPRQEQPARPVPAALDLLQLAGVGLIVVAAVASLAALAVAGGQAQPRADGGVSLVIGTGEPSPSQATASATPDAVTVAGIVVDVQGAVERSGLHRLPVGSRVGDAIAAAGGYSAQVDIAAAAQAINLAALLSDGQQVRVPRRGELVAAPSVTAPTGAPPAGSGGGLVDLNTATQAELEELPGIGPVTAGKIIAARAEAPFGSLDELVERKVLGSATLEKIRGLSTVGP